MNGLTRPKASRGSGAEAPGAHDPARQAPLARTPIFQATGGPQPVAAGVSAPLVDGLSPSRIDRSFGITSLNSFLNNTSASQLPENSHFVGATISQHTVSPTGNISMHASVVGSAEKEPIDIDGDSTPQPVRSEVRLNWTHKEDERLASAWLLNSLDPVDGNDKKSDQYWGDVTKTYNDSTTSSRTRNRNQLKIRWDRIKKPVSEFHGCWTRMNKIYQSGMSDDQITDQAMELYASEHSDKAFVLQHVWKVLRHERKWSAYVKKVLKEKDSTANQNPSSVVNIEDDGSQRPIGHKRAKEERNGKRKASDGISAISEKLEKFIEARQMAAKDREKMIDLQENLANKKLEAAKLAHKTAREKTKCKMLEMYKELLFATTSQLSEQALAEREKALESMRVSLFSKDDRSAYKQLQLDLIEHIWHKFGNSN